MNEYKDALLNSHSEVKGLQGELSELKKKLVKVEKSRAAMERVYVRTNRMCSHWKHKHAEEAEKNRILKQENAYLEAENKALKKSHKTEMLALQKDFAAKETALKDEICKLKAQLDRDGTTSGIPTSKTPINKDAHAAKDAKGIEEDGILPNLSKDTYLIRTYTETCKRNGVDEFEALYRLMSGNPYTLAEIIEKGKV